MLYCANITITIGFISLIFCVTYYSVFILIILTTQKYEQKYLVIISSYWGQASEPQVDLRDQLIFVSDVVYSCKPTVTIVTNFYLVW